MAAELATEGVMVTRAIASKAVLGDQPQLFRQWKRYERHHIELVRRLAKQQEGTR